MTSKTTQAGRRITPGPLARVLAFVLLALVMHTATVEIVHQHGNLSPANSTGAVALRDAGADQSTTGSSRSTGECLICQLHQNLFSTLLFNVPCIVPPQTEAAHVCNTFIPSPSETNAPRRGRAPPQTSLL